MHLPKQSLRNKKKQNKMVCRTQQNSLLLLMYLILIWKVWLSDTLWKCVFIISLYHSPLLTEILSRIKISDNKDTMFWCLYDIIFKQLKNIKLISQLSPYIFFVNWKWCHGDIEMLYPYYCLSLCFKVCQNLISSLRCFIIQINGCDI